MYKQITFVLLLGISAGTAFADTQRANYQNNASAEATTGYVSGLAIGGLVGGPPGAIFGAAIGAMLGDGFFVRKRANVLRVELYESQLQVAVLISHFKVLQTRQLLVSKVVPAICNLMKQNY